ncbi:MAG: membrane integrity-associated transporter subunit PqiC, partial [Deltaproteobacteria bacterium]|nr:membrane integrity-associated transporter subunit PqiC [Deltaproteobacteria bacterium]
MMFPIKTALFGILLMLLTGCASTEPSRFYTLTPIPGPDAEVLSETVAQDVSVGVGPINIPDYLDRQQIVTSSNQNEIKMSEFDRWAGSLEDSFARVLSENLSVLLSTDRVFLFPWRGIITVDYHIGVDVIQFDGELGGNASL